MSIDPVIVSAATFVGTALGAMGLHLDDKRKERASKGLRVALSIEDRALITRGHEKQDQIISGIENLHECMNDVKDGIVTLEKTLIPVLTEAGLAGHEQTERIAVAAIEAQRLVAETALKAQSVAIEQAVQRGIEQERARVAGGGSLENS